MLKNEIKKDLGLEVLKENLHKKSSKKQKNQKDLQKIEKK